MDLKHRAARTVRYVLLSYGQHFLQFPLPNVGPGYDQD